jgi:hypothetical protein
VFHRHKEISILSPKKPLYSGGMSILVYTMIYS